MKPIKTKVKSKVKSKTFKILSAILWALLFLGASEVFAVTDDEKTALQYTVDLEDARNHYLTIKVVVPVVSDTTELMMAVWTPGSYLVREYARNIDSMTVTSGDRELEFEKIRKNRWLVETKGIKSFEVSYRLYCNEMSVRTNWVGNQYAMINGAPTFITVPDRLDQQHEVQLLLPRNWTRSATSLKSVGDNPHRFVAENFDELVDSPIVAGNVSVYPFVVGGIEHQLVNVGESGYWDGTKAATDLKKIVEAHQEMWGVVPYDRYMFINMIVESGGGLEHDNSSVLMTSRWSFRDRGRYKSWLSLASHEFFHTWNIRRLRPKSLVTYDYENEVYTDSLWIAEGITSYYEDLALLRAGLLSRSEFLSRLSGDVEGVQRTGGRKLQSLKDSSYDAWIKYYRPDENSSNTRISYYSKGAVAAFLLDARIRKLTKGEKSLDDLMRKLFADYVTTGYTTDEFRAAASELAGEDLSDWFASVIDSTDELDYSDIEAIGVIPPYKKSATKATKESDKKESDKKESDKKESDKKESDKKESDKKELDKKDEGTKVLAGLSGLKDRLASAVGVKARTSTSRGRPYLGFRTSAADGIVKVTSVKPNSPASDVGINIEDEVIAVNGFRITSSVDSRLSQYEVGDELEILISRRGQLMTLNLTIGQLESSSYRLRFVSRPSKEQRRQLDLWLNGKNKQDEKPVKK
ncbi:PDZ domain-containing protein [Mariniblastus sp.]|nr:PDZ domain-containing protein [Mariniblastus sp.]